MDLQKIIPYQDLARPLKSHQDKSQTIVLVHGMFDMLHFGHIKLLSQAKQHADILVVGVEPDINTRELKGRGRPIHSEAARLKVLAHLDLIDYTFLIPEFEKGEMLSLFYQNIYQYLKPDIIASCKSAGKHGMLKEADAAQTAIRYVDLDSTYDRSTSKILQLLQQSS